MKVTLLQTDIKWSDPSANQHEAERLMEQAERSDLYVLPEMWTTGFATDPEGVAEKADGNGAAESVRWMQRMAEKLDAAVAGSVAIEMPDGRCYNRLYFVTPDGVKVHYDKRHLFAYGNENEHYTVGKERVVVEWRGVRFLLQICYDLRFPVFSRNNGDYDVAIYVANWPDSRRRVWDTLLKARALENQCYVVGVNRVGDDAHCHYDGGSAIIDAYGGVVAEAADGHQQMITAKIDLERLQRFREKFPVLADRDEFNCE